MHQKPEPPVRLAGGVTGAVAPVAGMYGATAEAAPALPNLTGLLGVARRNWWLIALASLLGFGAAYYLVSREPVLYRATALVRLMDAGSVAGGVIGQEVGGDGRASGSDPLLSEILVLQGRRVAGGVADREGLRLFDATSGEPTTTARAVAVTLQPDSARTIALEYDAARYTARAGDARAAAPYGTPVDLAGVQLVVPERPVEREATIDVVPREAAAQWVIASLSVQPREGTSALVVAFESSDAALSTRVVNAVVREYAAVNGAIARAQITRRRSFLEQQLRENEQAQAAAQLALDRFRGRERVYRSAEQSAAEQATMAQAEVRRQELEAERRAFGALLAELERSGEPAGTVAFRTIVASPAIAQNPVVARLYDRLSRYQFTVDSLRSIGRPETHDDVRQTREFMAATEAQLLDAVRTQIAALEARGQALDAMRRQSSAELRRLSPAEGEEALLLRQLETIGGMGDQLRAEYQRSRIAEAVEVGRVEIVDEAIGAEPLDTHRTLKLALGLMVGVMLGTSGALVRERRSPAIRGRDDVEQVLRVPGLVVVPRLPAPKKPWRWPARSPHADRRARNGPEMVDRRLGASTPGMPHPTLIAAATEHGGGAEAYRILGTRLAFLRTETGRPPTTLLVTSAANEEGKTTTAANLAITLARQGQRVLLMDCDLRRPRVHSLFGIPGKPGLTELLQRRCAPQEAIAPTSIHGLRVMPGGSVGDRSIDLLADARLGIVLQWVAKYYDTVVMDSAPILLVPDTLALAARADAVLLVVRAGHTARAMAAEAAAQIGGVGGQLVGSVLNDPDARAERYERYGYGYSRVS